MILVEKHTDGDNIELDKRTYLPVTISSKCTSCDSPVILDLRKDYLSYPVIDKWKQVTLYCRECEHEEVIEIVVSVNVKARKLKPEE